MWQLQAKPLGMEDQVHLCLVIGLFDELFIFPRDPREPLHRKIVASRTLQQGSPLSFHHLDDMQQMWRYFDHFLN
jgi:hypothetical protein